MNRKTLIRSLFVAIAAIELWVTEVAFAQIGAGGTGLTLTNPFGASCNDLNCPINNIIDFVFYISLPLVTIMVLWGGIQMATAAGNPEKFSTGKKTLLYAAVGFVVVLLAKGAGGTIQNFFGGK
jgi:hypothetical protein